MEGWKVIYSVFTSPGRILSNSGQISELFCSRVPCACWKFPRPTACRSKTVTLSRSPETCLLLPGPLSAKLHPALGASLPLLPAISTCRLLSEFTPSADILRNITGSQRQYPQTYKGNTRGGNSKCWRSPTALGLYEAHRS